MKRRFVIGVDGFSADESKRFSEYLNSKGAYWHWIENFWLLTRVTEDPEEPLSTKEIRDEVREINNTARALVLEVGADIDWSSVGAKNAKGKDQHEWIRKHWDSSTD